MVTAFAAALALVRGSDLVAAVPERHADAMRDGLISFPLPFSTPEVMVSMLWHPRRDADPGYRWLRACVRDTCGGRDAPNSPALAGPRGMDGVAGGDRGGTGGPTHRPSQ